MDQSTRRKIKEGNRVRVITCTEGYEDHEGEIGIVISSNSINEYPVCLDNGGGCIASEVELVMKTLDYLEVGDVLLDRDEDEQTVLAVCDKVVCLSMCNKPSVFDHWYTVNELKVEHLTITGVETEEAAELTVKEVAKRLGIKNLKIVKD